MFLRMIFERTHRPQVKDKFVRRYGGRLLGGMTAEPMNNLLTASQALGLSSENKPRPPAADTQVDPARLNLGDDFSFVYSRGARAGERRTVTLHEKEKVKGRTSLCLICWEEDPKRAGVVKSLKIWPSLTADVSYHKENFSRAESAVWTLFGSFHSAEPTRFKAVPERARHDYWSDQASVKHASRSAWLQ